MNLSISSDELILPNPNRMMKFCSFRIKGSPSTMDSIKSLLGRYRTRFIKINNIVSQDVSVGCSITLKKHTIDEENKAKLQTFLKHLRILNIDTFFKTELQTLENLPIKHSTRYSIRNHLLKCHRDFLSKWDSHLEHIILQKIDKKHQEKCNLSVGVFNFSNHVIPSSDIKLLQHGKNMIFPLTNSSNAIQRRIIKECSNYASRFRKYIEKNRIEITEDISNMESWFLIAIKTAITEE